MQKVTFCSWKRVLSFSAAILMGASASQFTVGQTHAQFAGCRSDPVIVLSNLGVLDLNAYISDTQTDVRNVVYTVHAPAGTRVLAIVNTDSLIGLKETVQFRADDSAKTYDVYTTVSTGQRGVPVTAGSTVVSLLNLVLGSASVPGLANQAVHAHFKTLL